MPKILAIDPSLNNLGYAFEETGTIVTGTISSGTGKKQLRGVARLAYHVESMKSLIATVSPELIVMEGYAMGAKGNTFDIGELGGVLKFEFYKSRIRTLIVPPSNLKLFATGKGNSKKEVIKQAIYDRIGYMFSSDDEADAYILYEMGVMYLKPATRPADKGHYQNKAIEGCLVI